MRLSWWRHENADSEAAGSWDASFSETPDLQKTWMDEVTERRDPGTITSFVLVIPIYTFPFPCHLSQ